jgi:hypothetical protein
MTSSPYPAPFLVADARALLSRTTDPGSFVRWAMEHGGHYRADPWAVLVSLLPPETLADRSLVYRIPKAGVTVWAVALRRPDCPRVLRLALEHARDCLVEGIRAHHPAEDVDGLLWALANPILPATTREPAPDGSWRPPFPNGCGTLLELAETYPSLSVELLRHPSATLAVYRAVATSPAVRSDGVARELARFPDVLDDPVIWDAILTENRTSLVDVVFDRLRIRHSAAEAARWFVQALRLDPAAAVAGFDDLECRGDLTAEHLVPALGDPDPAVRAAAVQMLAAVSAVSAVAPTSGPPTSRSPTTGTPTNGPTVVHAPSPSPRRVV